MKSYQITFTGLSKLDFKKISVAFYEMDLTHVVKWDREFKAIACAFIMEAEDPEKVRGYMAEFCAVLGINASFAFVEAETLTLV